MQETSLYQSYSSPILNFNNSLSSASFPSAYFHSASASLKVFNCPKNSFAASRPTTPLSVKRIFAIRFAACLIRLNFCLLQIGFCYLLGIIIAAMIYAQIPAPPKQVRITHARRTNVGSISKYSAIPPHTPQSILFSDDLYKRLSPMSISSLNPD